MGNRLSKIYTRTGDTGSTGLGDGTRVSKDDVRVTAYGDVDELNAAVGVVLTYSLPDNMRDALIDIQHDLFDLGGELCIPGHTMIGADHVSRLERVLDALNEELTPLKEFILPGGTQTSAFLHLARTVCRRAERYMITLHKSSSLNPHAIEYINRLSDLLFVMARYANKIEGHTDVLWNRQRD